MKYTVALSIAEKAAAYLQDNEGNMSESEVVVHVSALHLALKALTRCTFTSKHWPAGLGRCLV